MRSFLLLFVFGCSIGLYSQSLKTNYKPLSSYYPSKAYLTQVCAGYDSIYRAIDFEKRGQGRNFKNSMESQKKFIYSINEDSALMYNDVITNYIQRLAQHIKEKNPILKNTHLKIFTYRNQDANATNYGNGIILVNLNLLAQMNNEEELAFILCHEMSHEIKGHVIDGISRRYELSNDAELKKRFEEFKKKRYNWYKSYEAYVATVLLKISSKKREHEVQADSLGLVLYKNAGYKIQNAYNAMDRLDSIDNTLYFNRMDYQKYFSSSQQPFKTSWLEPEEEDETIGGGNLQNVKFPDSLKTHPDCKYRLKKMKDLKLTNGPLSNGVGGFDSIKKMAEYEMLALYLDDYNLSEGLYNCLQLYSENPTNLYLKASVLEYLYDIYVLKRNHYLSLTIDKPGPKFNMAYNEMLYFLNNVPPDACKIIMTDFFTSNFSETISDPFVAYVYLLIKSIDKPIDKRDAMVKEYASQFGKNDYYRLLNKKLLKKTV